MPLASRCYIRNMCNVMTVHFHPLLAKAIFAFRNSQQEWAAGKEEKQLKDVPKTSSILFIWFKINSANRLHLTNIKVTGNPWFHVRLSHLLYTEPVLFSGWHLKEEGTSSEKVVCRSLFLNYGSLNRKEKWERKGKERWNLICCN